MKHFCIIDAADEPGVLLAACLTTGFEATASGRVNGLYTEHLSRYSPLEADRVVEYLNEECGHKHEVVQ